MVSIKAIDYLAPLAQGAVSNPLGVFAPYVDLGVFVVFFALLFIGKLRRESEVKERDIKIDKLEKTIEQYVEHYQSEVLPALIDVTRVSGEVVSLLNRRRT